MLAGLIKSVKPEPGDNPASVPVSCGESDGQAATPPSQPSQSEATGVDEFKETPASVALTAADTLSSIPAEDPGVSKTASQPEPTAPLRDSVPALTSPPNAKFGKRFI